MTPLMASALVAGGGAIGALGRFWVAVLLAATAGTHLPFATFVVNVVGSFMIGLAAVLIGTSLPMKAFFITGILGGFTTFSTFSLETVELMSGGRVAAGLANAALSVAGCLVAASVGLAVGSRITA